MAQNIPSVEISSLVWNPRVLGSITQRIGAQETRRRLWHFLPGVIAFMLPFIPHAEVVRLWVMCVIVGCGILLPGYLAMRYQHVYARSRHEDLSPILGYMIPLAFLALLLRGTLEIPLAVAAIISFGDGSATICGLLTRGPRLAWNPRKSVAGLFAFMVAGSMLASLLYWIEASPGVSLTTSLMVVSPVAILCAFIESLPLKWNDNVTVGVTASALLIIQQALVIGAF